MNKQKDPKFSIWRSLLMFFLSLIFLVGIIAFFLSGTYCFNCKPRMNLNEKWVNYTNKTNSPDLSAYEAAGLQMLELMNDTLHPFEEEKIIDIFKNQNGDLNNLLTSLQEIKHHNHSVQYWIKAKFGESNYIDTESVVTILKSVMRFKREKPLPFTNNIHKINSLVFFNDSISYKNTRSYLTSNAHLKLTNDAVRNLVAQYVVFYAKKDTLMFNPEVRRLFREVEEKTPYITRGNADNQIFNSFKSVYKPKNNIINGN